MRELTYDLIMAAARDAGNRSMRNAGRTVWNADDWAAACRVSERLHRIAGVLSICHPQCNESPNAPA